VRLVEVGRGVGEEDRERGGQVGGEHACISAKQGYAFANMHMGHAN